MRDPVACLAVSPTAAWLIPAILVAIAQALWNRDPFWRIGPPVAPNRRWLKQPKSFLASIFGAFMPASARDPDHKLCKAALQLRF